MTELTQLEREALAEENRRAASVTQLPTRRARIAELISLVRTLSLEVEATRRQTSFVGEMVQDLLRAVGALKP